MNRTDAPRGPRMRQPHYDASLLAGASSRVHVQIYPLLADIGRLQTLCDKLYNEVVPPSVAIFRPALPMVFVGALYYPEMSGELPWVTGTMSQHELYFLVPLERYRAVNGREEFVELCGATPYIFVDNAESAATGRERLGLPKELAAFTAPLQGAFSIGDEELLEVQTWEPSKDGLRLSPLLQILDVTRPPFQLGGRGEAPLPAGFDPLAWLKFSDALKASAEHTLGKETAQTSQSILNRLEAYGKLLAGSRSMSLYAVRQFPDPEHAGRARYQDLVQFRMNVSDVQSVGFLGNGPLASHYKVGVRRSESRPITRVLGLRVDQASDTFDIANAIAPLSAQVDVDFVSATRLCWRASAEGGAWYDVDGNALSKPTTPRYTTVLGPTSAMLLARQASTPVLDVKYLLVPASRATLQHHIDRLVPRHSQIRAQLVGSGDVAAVRVLASKSRPEGDEEDGLVWSDGYYVSVSAPVLVTTQRASFLANLIFDSFTTNGFMVQALRETLAEPAEEAEITGGDAGWFGSTQGIAALLNVATLDITRTANQATVGWLPLIDFVAADDGDADEALDAFRAEAWPLMAKVLPTISVGRIPWPETSKGSVIHRITRLDFDTADAAPVALVAKPQRYFLGIHEHETRKLATELGLIALPAASPLATKIRRRGASIADVVVVPVAGYGEGVARIPLHSFDILWESDPLERRAGR